MEAVATSLRALASPPAVVALVVLALNDHVLKQAWPGPVTGKLSDVTGLVVAPLLLAVPLALAGVRRAGGLACAVTAVGFAAVKLSPAVAAGASAAWSLSGFPTRILADPTDLLALPAVLLAWWLHRRAAVRPPLAWRRVVAVATGTALLPLGVVATAATSCEDPDGVTGVWVAEGTFTSAPAGQGRRLVVDVDYAVRAVDQEGRVAALSATDANRLQPGSGQETVGCDGAGTCWRLVDAGLPDVEVSTDGGVTWQSEYEVTVAEAEEALDEADGGCGEEPDAKAHGLAVLAAEPGGGTWVAVAAGFAGLLLRSPDGEWRREPFDELLALSAPKEDPAPGEPITWVPPTRP